MKKKALLIIIGIICVVIVVALGMKAYSAYELKNQKKKYIKIVESKVDENKYREKEKTIIIDLKKDTKAKILKTDSVDKLQSNVDQFDKSVEKLKTDKELDEIEKKEAIKKEKARKKAEAKKKAAAKKKAEEEKKAEQESRNRMTTVYRNTNTNTNSGVSAGGNSAGSNNSGGCVGNDAKNFY